MYRIIFLVALLFQIYSLNAQDASIMTYNIRLNVASDNENAWPNRKTNFIHQLKFYEPDIIGFQEVTPNQLMDLAEELKEYNYVGKGRELDNQGESSNIFYKKEKFVLKDSGTFWLSDTPDKVSMGWDAACNRVCTYALLHDIKKKQSFYVFNTHLDHVGEIARTKGLELIIEKIEKINKKKLSVFLMGDFNTTPDTERIKWLNSKMDNTKTISQSPSFGPNGTFNGFKHHEPVTLEIDYIYLSKSSKFKIIKHAVLSDSKDLRYPSDHLPVLTFFKYK
jgi:endonuclease/exonuclease/phosphatase family metal-dependent hydrolase